MSSHAAHYVYTPYLAHDNKIITSNTSHVRVKRRNQTFFIPTSPSDSFAYIKEEICRALGGDDAFDPKLMRLYIDNTDNDAGDADEGKETKKGPIPDAALLSDHDVKNDDIIILEVDEV